MPSNSSRVASSVLDLPSSPGVAMCVRVSILSLLISSAIFCQSYTISTFAGGPPHTAAHAVSAAIGNPAGVAVDSTGSIYFFSRNCVFKVDSTGALTRIAGNYTAGYSGDGGPATSAQIHMPLVANAALGNLQVYGNLAVDHGGNVYIPDPFANRVRKVSPAGVISTVAGNGSSYNGLLAAAGDGGQAANAELTSPHHVAVDGNGNLYISEARIRKVTPDGIIHTVPAPSYYWDVAVDQTGNLYGAKYNPRAKSRARWKRYYLAQRGAGRKCDGCGGGCRRQSLYLGR
jgi:hypothetical protein